MSCKVCINGVISDNLDLGLQPISNRFLSGANEKQDLYPLQMAVCQDCGMVQLNDLVSADDLAPPFAWMSYNEPEDHLDELASIIEKLPGIGSGSVAHAVSYKDDTLLQRLAAKGIQTYRLDSENDLNIHGYENAGVELVQDRLQPALSESIAKAHGQADILIARHILEHAHDLRGFMEALLALTKTDGFIVLEVPDEQRALDLQDVMVAWEEHVVYFTPATLKGFLSRFPCQLVTEYSHAYPFENSLIMIVQKAEKINTIDFDKHELLRELERFRQFSDVVNTNRELFRRVLENYKAQGKKIAVLGAGHLTIKFINIYGLSDLIEFVIDDNPNKQNLLLPGSKLPILPSKALLENDIQLCLLGVNPSSEHKVLAANQAFVDKGGEFRSIFSGSDIALSKWK